MNEATVLLIGLVAAMPFTAAYYSTTNRSGLSLFVCIVLGMATVYGIGALLWVTRLGVAL